MMKITSNRQEKFLSNYSFYPNSINFRITSSKALEKWKNVQSFQLNQLINGKFEFSRTRREILLLKYDLWSQCLYEIENYAIESPYIDEGEDVTQQDIENIVNLAKKAENIYHDIVTHEDNEVYFDQEFSKIWLQFHDNRFELFIEDLSKLSGNMNDVYIKIVDSLCSLTQYTIIEMLEISVLLDIRDKKSDESAFLVVTEYCSGFHDGDNLRFLTTRALFYKKYFNLSEVYIKNYTSSPIPLSIARVVESLGIGINYEKCAFE